MIDFFPKDYLLVIDESHATVPQIGAMFEGDRSRKNVLVEYGFRLPSALDNRPLKFQEFQAMQNQAIYVQRHAGEAGNGMGAAKRRSAGLRPERVCDDASATRRVGDLALRPASWNSSCGQRD